MYFKYYLKQFIVCFPVSYIINKNVTDETISSTLRANIQTTNLSISVMHLSKVTRMVSWTIKHHRPYFELPSHSCTPQHLTDIDLWRARTADRHSIYTHKHHLRDFKRQKLCCNRQRNWRLIQGQQREQMFPHCGTQQRHSQSTAISNKPLQNLQSTNIKKL